jgi:hypothetical protein
LVIETGLPTLGRRVGFLPEILQMGKAIFIGFIVLGAAMGVFFALEEDFGLKVVFACVGCVVGAAIGGALSKIGDGHGQSSIHDGRTDGLVAVQEEQARNYWLDRGRPTASPGLPHADDSDPHSREP